MATRLRVPRYTYQQLGDHAEAFLQEHHRDGVLPVDIDNIVDVQMGVHITTIQGLYRDLGIYSFITSDFSEIKIDEWIYYNREQRYRYSLAHEVAHSIIHREVFAASSVGSISQYITFLHGIDARDHGKLEEQAYDLAGLILVPPAELEHHFLEACAIAEQNGKPLGTCWEAACMPVCERIGRAFVVSRPVVEKRIDRDELCRRFLGLSWSPR